LTGPVCLETRDLCFAYEDGPLALRGISLTIEEGDFVALIGQNGSGKTTLAKHFNGLLRPTQGQVLLNGQDIRDQSVSMLAHTVGYVFQNPDHQIFSATTWEEVAVGPRNLGLNETEVQRRVEETLATFGLTPFADRQPAVLGFGLRRKISVAGVYAMESPVLILDEPTTGLDLKSTTELMERTCELHQQGHTIILITHDMRVVAEYAPRCMVLREGQLVAYDDTRAIFKQVDLLRETHIELPQISELGRRMVPYGLRDDILTVPEFCDSYSRLVSHGRRAEVSNADRR
jgi:energy-coupling factor transporter ATP-binding protein EcfA2